MLSVEIEARSPVMAGGPNRVQIETIRRYIAYAVTHIND